MPDPTTRRFDDEEVALILRRAAEMQEARTGTGAGLTLADLEEVAREAGLDPALVRRAAADVALGAGRRPEPRGSWFLGAPTKLRAERIVDGELTPDGHEAVVEEIRRTLRDVGIVSVLGRTLAWRTSPSLQRRHAAVRDIGVTIVTRDGQTAVRVEEATNALAGGLFGGLMGGLGGGGGAMAISVGLGALHSGVAAAGLWAGVVATAYGLARTIYGRVTRGRSDALVGLADRLAAVIEDSVPPRAR